MEFKGTKGEWKVNNVESTDFISASLEITYGSNGECVAEYVHNEYDAQLIASAPDLLEALIESQKHLVEIGTEDSGQQYYSNMQAINKALNK